MNIYVGLGGYAIRCLAYLYKERNIDDELIFIDSDKSSDISDLKLEKARVIVSENSELTLDEYSILKNNLDGILYGQNNNLLDNNTININILTTMCGNFGSSNVFIIGNLFRNYLNKAKVKYNITFLLIPILNVSGTSEVINSLFEKRIDKFITLYNDSCFSKFRRDDRVRFYVPVIKNPHPFFHEKDDFKIEIYEALLGFCFHDPDNKDYIYEIITLDNWIESYKLNNYVPDSSNENLDELSNSFMSDFDKTCFDARKKRLKGWLNNALMKKNNKIAPYIGQKSYIFISYAHKDKKEVYPIIDKLLNDGFRVWYDDGIDPGTEWDENIAKHIEECGYFIPFISENYLKSSNCKDELNFARDLDKDRFLVYLENVNLPSGMNMRLSRLQNIHKYAYGSFDEFYNKLLTAKGINSFK